MRKEARRLLANAKWSSAETEDEKKAEIVSGGCDDVNAIMECVRVTELSLYY